jgi:probable LLM family oxidoreductase
MQIGIDSFAAVPASSTSAAPAGNHSGAERLTHLIEEIVLADQAGVEVFGLGEHHREEYLDSAPAVILAAAASRTRHIRLASAVTVLSAADPVRVFQSFATLDLLSLGRAEIVVGRGSFIESFPLFGLNTGDYDDLFADKLDLLLKLRDETYVHWQSRHSPALRPALSGQGVFPRPLQARLPIWLGVGGTPASFARAGSLGLPLMVAIIGGEPHRFRPLIDLYREAGARAGFAPHQLQVGIHALAYVADTDKKAADDFFPGYAAAFTKIGKERGWPPVTRAQFEALRRPSGALIVSDPAGCVEKILHYNESLGGIARLSFQMSVAELPHPNLMRAIELLGTDVIPRLRIALGTPASQPSAPQPSGPNATLGSPTAGNLSDPSDQTNETKQSGTKPTHKSGIALVPPIA